MLALEFASNGLPLDRPLEWHWRAAHEAARAVQLKMPQYRLPAQLLLDAAAETAEVDLFGLPPPPPPPQQATTQTGVSAPSLAMPVPAPAAAAPAAFPHFAVLAPRAGTLARALASAASKAPKALPAAPPRPAAAAAAAAAAPARKITQTAAQLRARDRVRNWAGRIDASQVSATVCFRDCTALLRVSSFARELDDQGAESTVCTTWHAEALIELRSAAARGGGGGGGGGGPDKHTRALRRARCLCCSRWRLRRRPEGRRR